MRLPFYGAPTKVLVACVIGVSLIMFFHMMDSLPQMGEAKLAPSLPAAGISPSESPLDETSEEPTVGAPVSRHSQVTPGASAVIDGFYPQLDSAGGRWDTLPHGSNKKRYCVSVLTAPRLDDQGVDHSALLLTVRDLVQELEGRWGDVTIFIYNSARNWTDYDLTWSVAAEFAPLIEDGCMLIGHAPYAEGSLWSELDDPSKLYANEGEPIDRILWRTKTVFDYLHALHVCSQLGEMVLAIDDDLIPTRRVLDKIDAWFVMHPQVTPAHWWSLNLFTTSHYRDGEKIIPSCCNQAYLIQSSDVPLVDTTIRAMFDRWPLDLALSTMARTNEPKAQLAVIPNMFQHRKIVSSFAQNGIRTFITSPSFQN